MGVAAAVASAVSTIGGTVASVIGQRQKAKVQRKAIKAQQAAHQQALQFTRERMQAGLRETQPLLQPLFSQYQIGQWQTQARDEMAMALSEARRELDSAMAMRGIARSGVAQDLYFRMRLQNALNTVRQQQEIQKLAMLANRQALLSAMSLRQNIRAMGTSQVGQLYSSMAHLTQSGGMQVANTVGGMYDTIGYGIYRLGSGLAGMLKPASAPVPSNTFASAGYAAGTAAQTASFLNPFK